MTIFTTARAFALALAVSFLSGEATAAAPDAGAQDAAGPTTVKIPARYEFYARKGLPPEYKGKTNPNPAPTVPIVIRGADFYNENCSSCHGLMGFGNGASGNALRPRPADLAWSMGNPALKDDFFLWTISEGGAQFGSDMPAYKGVLREGQIWELITYMRAAFEGREARAPDPRDARQAIAAKVE